MTQNSSTQTLLHERARKLAARTDRGKARQLFERVTLIEAGRERYGIPLAHLREIAHATPITPLPGLPSFMLGVSAVRGELFSVVDLAQLRGGSRTANTNFFGLVHSGNRTLAIGFSAVLALRDVFSDEIAAELLTDVLVDKFTRALTRDYVSILDVERLLHSERLIAGQPEARDSERSIGQP